MSVDYQKSNLYIYPKFTNRPLRGKPEADRGKRALAHILDRGPDLRCGYNACRQLGVWIALAKVCTLASFQARRNFVQREHLIRINVDRITSA